MKKIISLLMSVAMLASLVTVANADEVKPTLTTTYRQLDLTNDADKELVSETYMDVEWLEGTYYAYEVTTVVSNIPAEITATFFRNNYTYDGTSIQSIKVAYKFDADVPYKDSYGWMNPKKGAENGLGLALQTNGVDCGASSEGTAATQATYILSKDGLAGTEPYTTATTNEATTALDTLTFKTVFLTIKDTFDIDVEATLGLFNVTSGSVTGSQSFNPADMTFEPATLSIAPSQGGGDEGDDDDDTSVLVDVAGLTGELEQYNGKKMFRAKATGLTADADDKLVITSVDTDESRTMARTLWDALDITGTDPVSISDITVVVMVTADADTYANGFTFDLQ